MRKVILFASIFFLVVFLSLFSYLFVGEAPKADNIAWGANFSAKHAELLSLDWKETYKAILQDLQVKQLKIAIHWDDVHLAKDQFQFEDIDWQMELAKEYDVKVMLVVGMKTPRWPECHIPEWAFNLSKEKQQEAILNMLSKVVERYKDNSALSMWQVENEPFFPFGECPWKDSNFLKKEVNLVQSLDPSHPIVITDSGEFSLWIKAGSIGDIVGVTLYQKTWFKWPGIYVDYFFPPVFYQRKAELVSYLFGKDVMVVELQGEPWGPKLLYNLSLKEQAKTMNIERFRDNVEFAQQTGLKEFYLWGTEWWYWMKEKHNDDAIWQEAKKLFIP